MMNYYLSKLLNTHYNKFLIHRETCKRLPNLSERIYLGSWKRCHDAVKVAEKFEPRYVDGCRECCTECHTS